MARRLFLLLLATALLAPAAVAEPARPAPLRFDFEATGLDALPGGWKIETTGRQGPLATWGVIAEETAPSGSRVLAMRSPNHSDDGSFNLCWTESVRFRDGKIGVRFKAETGEVDQGGGVIWRARDQDNYYIARFNPLEDNFRIYYVKAGARKMLASVRIKLPAGWHALAIVHRGERIEGYLDGELLLETDDGTFPEPGGVGLWTKADAVTSFDDFYVEPEQ
ncbi:MAG: hypothetical protein GY719_03355 [bacterium]|nr:hypothetical protein [bacterium]